MSSDVIAGLATRETSFLPFLHFLLCMTQRSLNVVDKGLLQEYIMLCYSFPNERTLPTVLMFPT
jgi:hypothetical protein